MRKVKEIETKNYTVNLTQLTNGSFVVGYNKKGSKPVVTIPTPNYKTASLIFDEKLKEL